MIRRQPIESAGNVSLLYWIWAERDDVLLPQDTIVPLSHCPSDSAKN